MEEMINIPKIELVDRNKLLIDESNPNVMSDAVFAKLKNNIKKYGFLIPIITNKSYKIADGFHRWKAARDLLIDKVPVIALDIEDVDRRMLRQILNKLRGSHDADADLEEYRIILESGHLDEFRDLIDIDHREFRDLLDEDVEMPLEDADVVSVGAYDRIKKKGCSIKLGDVIELGGHRLMCGDSTNSDHVNKLMDGNKTEVVFTDPPYGIDTVSKNGSLGGGTQGKYIPVIGDESVEVAKKTIKIIKDLKPTRTLIWGGNYFTDVLPPTPSWIVWDKQDGKHVTFADCEMAWTDSKKPARIFKHVWDGFRRDSEKGQMRTHPTQKPVALFVECLKEISEGDVLDLFGGSGSTLIACETLKRKCFMMEIDPIYCQIIINRYNELNKKKGEK